MTTATCTPVRTTSAIWRATCETTSGSSPTCPPPNISPPSLSSTRVYLGRFGLSSGNASAPLVLVGSCSVIRLLAWEGAIQLSPKTTIPKQQGPSCLMARLRVPRVNWIVQVGRRSTNCLSRNGVGGNCALTTTFRERANSVVCEAVFGVTETDFSCPTCTENPEWQGGPAHAGVWAPRPMGIPLTRRKMAKRKESQLEALLAAPATGPANGRCLSKLARFEPIRRGLHVA